MKLRRASLAAAAGLFLASLGAQSGSVSAAPERPVWIASFEGGTIDLRKGWGEATACRSDAVTTECFRTEAELNATAPSFATTSSATSSDVSALLVDCGSPVRLWSGLLRTGSYLELWPRGVLHNLASYGFNNLTSSYTIGACSATFFDTTTGSTIYPGNTSAFASASSMLSGWDNRVGSVRLS